MAVPRSISGSSYDNNSMEQEQDANSALMELDKGLRSLNIGDQCEAVVRFPRLFEKYPFPILINSALLKLAEVFRAGCNFIRICILRVTQQSEKHLDKVLNVDEFIRRIFSVIHSNDPVARAITLRTLGSIANIIPERKNVHHSIVMSLDSNDAIEVDAAIYAAERFSAKSRTFATNICTKIAEMIERVASPVELKLCLIPILQYMHHDAATATKARKMCLVLLSSYPAKAFVTLTLHTMTHLAAHSLVDIQKQVVLLMSYLQNDPRQAVKVVSLKDLKMLAKKAPHQWCAETIEKLSGFVLDTPFVSLKIGALHVLTALSRSISLYLLPAQFVLSGSKLLDVCVEFSYHNNLGLSSKTVELLIHLAVHYGSKGHMNLIENAQVAANTLILLGSGGESNDEQNALKLGLRCAVKMCSTFPSLSTSFVNTIASLLQNNQVVNEQLVCESLAAIGSTNSEALETVLPTLLTTLQTCAMSDKHCQNAPQISTLLFQTARGETMPEEVERDVVTAAAKGGAWQAYRVVRQAMRYGQYCIAEIILKDLTKKVASEHFFFWLTGLHDLCVGESGLVKSSTKSSHMTRATSKALAHYQKGISQLKAATTPTFPLHFQYEYVQLKAQLVQQHCQLIETCSTFQTCPPPAIASALAMSNSSDISRCSQVTNQLSKCMQNYTDLGNKLVKLYQSAFNADPVSLTNIQLLYQSSELMETSIETILSAGQNREPLSSDKSSYFQEVKALACPISRHFLQTLDSIGNKLRQLTDTSGRTALTHVHMEFLRQSAQRLIQTTLGYPRYFFQSLQITAVKLAISPQPSNAMEPVSVQLDTQLTLKVEGVIQHGTRPGLFHNAQAVSISIYSQLQTRSSSTDGKFKEQVTNKLVKTFEPQNDYFSLNFLLAFPTVGVHVVTIEASLIDENGSLWKTGPNTTMLVKSYDDLIQRQQTSRMMSWTTNSTVL